jgi:hypothetical protein
MMATSFVRVREVALVRRMERLSSRCFSRRNLSVIFEQLVQKFRAVDSFDPNRFVSRSVAAHNLDLTARAIQFFGKQIDERLIGSRVNRRRGHFNFQRVTERSGNFVRRRARLKFD